MKTFFTDLWNDPAKFTAACRSLGVMVAGFIFTGLIPLPGFMAGWPATLLPILLAGGVLGFPAGQKNK